MVTVKLVADIAEFEYSVHLQVSYFGQMSKTNPGPTWDDVKWFCELTSLPVIIKGIMTTESARMAVQVGAKGVIVSNHGGR